MKRTRFPLVVLFMVLTTAAFPEAEETQPRVAVLPINHPEKIKPEDAAALTAVFETALIRTGAFIVVKQSAVGTILAAQSFSRQDFADQDYAVQVGRLISANHIFTGEISQLGNNYLLTIQLVNIESGKVLQAEQLQSLSAEGFLQKVESIAGAFAARHGQSGQRSVTGVKKAEIYVGVGDKFLAELNFEKAVEQYEKALEQDEFNTALMLKVIDAKVQKILTETLYHSQAVHDGLDVALRYDYEYVKYVKDEETNNVLEYILMVKTVDKAMEKDLSLLTQEALLYKATGKMQKAAAVLEKAAQIAPGNPGILAERGLITAVLAYNAGKEPAGLDSIREAIRKEPENPLYHLYLARSLERANSKIIAETLKEYRKAAELAIEEDFRTKRVRQFAAQSLQRAYYDMGAMEGGVLTPAVDLSLEERLEHLLFLQNNGITFYSRTDTRNPEYFLANLYLATGKIMEADKVLRQYITDKGADWLKNAHWLKLAAGILEKGGHDKPLLQQVKEALDKLKK